MAKPSASWSSFCFGFVACLLALLGVGSELGAQSPTWQQRTVTAPPARNSSAAAYDVYRGVTTVFGGYNGTTTALGDTWEWNGTLWAPRITAVRPSARWGHGMAFDSKRGRVVLFGGYDGSVWRNDTWEWDGFAWTQRNLPTAPTARGYFGMTYDAARGVVVAFGGAGNLAIFGDTWEYDGFGWTQRSSASAPSPRRGVAMAWDETRRETLLFGGGDGTTVGNDLWAWNGVTWSQKTVMAAPPARWEGYFAFDGNCGRALLFGGADPTFATNYNDSWAWDGLQWTQVAGAQPPARHGAAQVHDAQRGQFVLWGGRDAAGFRNDTWELGPSCSRTMSVVAAPVVGQTAQFRYDYPGTAANLHFCWTLLTPRQPAAFALPIPGLPTIGLCRVDLFNQLLDPAVFLDGSGSLVTSVAIPANPALNGFDFDVQSVDLDLFTLALRWAENDVEVSTVAAPTTSFTLSPSSGAAPLTVSFINTTAFATSYSWDFGDGTSSSAANPPPKIYFGGTYTVSLTANGPGGALTAQQVLTVTGLSSPPVAGFSVLVACGGNPIHFTDTSTNSPTAWQWDFNNDGVVDSTQQNPAWNHNYASNLTNVRLVAYNYVGAGVVTKGVYLHPMGDMVSVAPGTFFMGSPEPFNLPPYFNQPDSMPVHQVTITYPFWIGRHEVTQAQYQAVMGSNPSVFQGVGWPNSGGRPVENVSWFDAIAFCAALTAQEQAAGCVPTGYQYRLPTEAEWEYCCRAGTNSEYSTGPALLCGQANFFMCFGTPQQGNWYTTPVGSYAPNTWGIYDMHGNVHEWCLDSYGSYGAAPVVDPFVTGGPIKVLRGGAALYDSSRARSAFRIGGYPQSGQNLGCDGFRLVLAPVRTP